MEYAKGTRLDVRQPWGTYTGGRALCSDGIVRRLHTIAETADTAFSVPASVQVSSGGRRVTISGYVTVETASGSSVARPDDPAIVKFVAVTSGKNAGVLPPRAYRTA